MSLFNNVSMLSTAMRNFQYGLDLSANNVANSGTLGYSRQRLAINSLSPIFDGQLLIGSGANATDVTRLRDIFLDSRIKYELSELGRATAKNEALTELAAIFPEVAVATSTAGLKGAIDNVVAKWTALAAAPASIAAKTDVREALRALADMLSLDARKTFDLQQRVNTDINLTINEINTLVDQISAVNQQLKKAPGNGMTGAPGALLDIREQAAEKLAKLIDTDFRVGGDGQMVVSFGTGVLVDAQKATHLIAINSPYDPGRTAIGYPSQAGAAARNITTAIQGGKLGGLLAARDGEIERARLDLDRMAYGIISRTNEINRGYKAGDGTTSHDIFGGSRAADIVLQPTVSANPDYIGGTRDAAAPGDLAKIQQELKSFIQYSAMRTAPTHTPGVPTPIDPDAPLKLQTWTWSLNATPPVLPPAIAGQIVISTTGNAVTVDWNEDQSLNEVIRNINVAGAGAFYATYDAIKQELLIVGETPMTVYDKASNLLEAFGVSSVVTSSSPINNYPVAAAVVVDPFGAMNNTQNLLGFFSSPLVTGGTVLIDNTPVNWSITDDLTGAVNAAITTATAPPNRVSLNFDSATQIMSIIKTGDPSGANPGALNFGLGNTMRAIQIVDKTGNLTRALNLDTNTNASGILDELISTTSSRMSAEGVLVQQAQALVDQTQALQDAESGFDPNAELAQARLYQRSYEAAVRLQYIMDDILNVLINRTGTSGSSGSAI